MKSLVAMIALGELVLMMVVAGLAYQAGKSDAMVRVFAQQLCEQVHEAEYLEYLEAQQLDLEAGQ